MLQHCAGEWHCALPVDYQTLRWDLGDVLAVPVVVGAVVCVDLAVIVGEGCVFEESAVPGALGGGDVGGTLVGI